MFHFKVCFRLFWKCFITLTFYVCKALRVIDNYIQRAILILTIINNNNSTASTHYHGKPYGKLEHIVSLVSNYQKLNP